MPFVQHHISQFQRPGDDVQLLKHHDGESIRGDTADLGIDAMSAHKLQTSTPSIPARSTMRASRLLQGMTLPLHDIKNPANFDAHLTSGIHNINDPHEMYLSSEEDGSESADESVDGSDASYVELDEEFQSTSTRPSFEETAKAIAFIFSGRASVITVCSGQVGPVGVVVSSHASRAPSLRPSLFRSNTSKSSKSSATASRRPSSSSIQSSAASTVFTDYGSVTDPMPTITTSRSHLSLAPITRSRSKSQASSRRQTMSPYPPEDIPQMPLRSSQTPRSEQEIVKAHKSSSKGSLGKWSVSAKKKPSMPFLSTSFSFSRDLLNNVEVTTRPPATEAIDQNPVDIPVATGSIKTTKSNHKKNRLSLNMSSLNLIAALDKLDQTSTKRESGIQSATEGPTGYSRIDERSEDIVVRTTTVSDLDIKQAIGQVRSHTTGDLNQLLSHARQPSESTKSSARSPFKLFGSWGKSTARA